MNYSLLTYVPDVVFLAKSKISSELYFAVEKRERKYSTAAKEKRVGK